MVSFPKLMDTHCLLRLFYWLFQCLISTINCCILLSGGFVASLPAGASYLHSSLSSPVINIHDYEWKCLRFWYFIGSDEVRDWHTASLMVYIRKITSNQTMLLFFEEEVTDKAQYTQIPLPSNYNNVQVFTELVFEWLTPCRRRRACSIYLLKTANIIVFNFILYVADCSF